MRPSDEPSLVINLLKGITANDLATPVRLTAQQRHLLFALLTSSDGSVDPRHRVVHDGHLLALVWGDQQDKRHSLHTAMSKLRRPFPGRIVRTAEPGGYTFEVLPGERVDLWCWWDMLNSLNRAVSDDPHMAAIAAPTALSMCDLESLAALPDTPAMNTVRDGIVTDYLTTAAQLAEVQLSLGDNRAVIAALPRLVGTHHEHEHLRAMLMLALVREQRPEEALRLYDELAALREQRGHQPGLELATIRRRVMNNDPALLETKPPALPAADRAVITARGNPNVSTTRMIPTLLGRTSPHDPDGLTTAADRAALILVTAVLPEVSRMVRETDSFISAFIRRAAGDGINRFLILGSLYPPTEYRTARLACPTGVHVVYTHFEQSLIRHVNQHGPNEVDVSFVYGTLGAPEELLCEPAIRDLFQLDRALEDRQPVAVADRHELNRIPVEQDIARLYGELFDELPPGSMLGMVSSTDDDMAPLAHIQLAAVYAQDPQVNDPIHRTLHEFIAAVPESMEIAPPGAVDVHKMLPAARLGTTRHEVWRHYSLIAVKRDTTRELGT